MLHDINIFGKFILIVQFLILKGFQIENNFLQMDD